MSSDRVLRLLAVPGTNPGRWIETWRERMPVPLELVPAEAADQAAALLSGAADLGLVRTPLPKPPFSLIPLYDEVTVVVLPSDHPLADEPEIDPTVLTDDLLVPDDDLLAWSEAPLPRALARAATTAEAVELVAAGAGVLAVPMSLARLHHRRDLTHVPLTDAPTSGIGLAWVTERHDELTEEFIGIVRGRTVNSSRGVGARPVPDAARPAEAARSPRKGAGRGQRGAGPRRGTPPKNRRRGR